MDSEVNYIGLNLLAQTVPYQYGEGFPGDQAVTGTILEVIIYAESWDNPGTLESLHCGRFEVDGFTLNGPPATATIKAVSVPLKRPIRRETKNRGWENVRLSKIAGDIAEGGGLSLMFEVDNDPWLDRVDQRLEADLPFLQRICESHGAKVKVTDDRLIVFNEQKYEERDPVITFKAGDNRVLSYSFTLDSSDAANSATVSYKDPKSGRLVEGSFTPPETAPAVGVSLVVNQRPGNLRGCN